MSKPNTQFKLGQEKPKGSGRRAGTPNRRTKDLTSLLEKLGIDPIEIIASEMCNLAPEKRVNTALELMRFIYPLRKPTDPTIENESIPEFTEREVQIIGRLSQRSHEFFDSKKS